MGVAFPYWGSTAFMFLLLELLIEVCRIFPNADVADLNIFPYRQVLCISQRYTMAEIAEMYSVDCNPELSLISEYQDFERNTIFKRKTACALLINPFLIQIIIANNDIWILVNAHMKWPILIFGTISDIDVKSFAIIVDYALHTYQ